MIAAEGLAAVGRMIAAYRRSDGAATYYKIAWVTGRCGILRVMDDVWVRMDSAHRRLWTDVVRRAQPGYVAAPASLLALAVWQSGNGAMQARPTRLRPVAREPRAAAAPASVGPASEGRVRS